MRLHFCCARTRDSEPCFFLFERRGCPPFSVAQKSAHAEILHKTFQKLSPRSVQGQRNRNCCNPISFREQIFLCRHFPAAAKLQRLESVSPDSKSEHSAVFRPRPSSLRSPAIRLCDSEVGEP